MASMPGKMVPLTFLALLSSCATLPPSPPPAPPGGPPTRTLTVHLSQDGSAGASVLLEGDRLSLPPVTVGADGTATFAKFPTGVQFANLHIRHSAFASYDCVWKITANEVFIGPGDPHPVGADGSVCASELTALNQRRHGIVRGVGKAVTDDDGLFHPLGITFLWALYGEKFEHDRMLSQLTFLAPYKFDYIRILAEVGWPGETIDPNWDDYEARLGHLIDDAYQVAGLRTEITLIGGGTGHDPMDLAAKVGRVVSARPEKVIALEMANESFQNGPHTDVMIQMALYLKSHTPSLIALSSPGDLEGLKTATSLAGASMFTMHIERADGDRKWRQIRQGWDFKDLPWVVDSNEPPGLHSSVGTNDSPIQLAMMRATGILSGGAMYVLHVGDMVAGRVDPSRGRVANLSEVSNIDTILKAVRGIDSMLPQGIENWRKYNNSWAGHPLTTTTFWGDGATEGVNRNYAASEGGSFVIVEDGVLNQVVSTARRAMHVDAYDPLTGLVLFSVDLQEGQTWTLPGSPDAMTAYIIKGS